MGIKYSATVRETDNLNGPYAMKSLAGKKFGEFAIFKHLAKMFSKLIDWPKGY